MGIHWYAQSKELIEIAQQFEEVERRIVKTGADKRAVDAALDDRDVLFAHERAARAELETRGLAVTIKAALEWPPDVSQHIHALGPADPDQSLLELLGWGTDYYVENLRIAGVPMKAFSQRLDYLRASPQQGRDVGVELLHYASRVRHENAARRAREAGLWLCLWSFVDCSVEAGQ